MSGSAGKGVPKHHFNLKPDPRFTSQTKTQGFNLNEDSRNSVMPFPALHAAFVALDGVQSLPPHLQVTGVAVLFREMCVRLNLDIAQVLNAAERISRDADSNYSAHLAALQGYIDNELKFKK